MTLPGFMKQIEMEQTNHLFICSCHSTEHQMVMHKSDATDWYPPEVYVHVHLIRRSFWYRLKYGLKYIFGYKSKFGAWDEFILDSSHVKDLEQVIQHLKDETVQTTSNP